MVNYKNGKIYKIVDNTNDNFYVGSTTKEYLSQRLEKHRGYYNEFIKGSGQYMSSMEIIDNGNYSILLLEKYSCNSKDELTTREQYWMDNLRCDTMVNKQNAKRKPNYEKEYYENNKEEILEKRKEYRETHKEEISKRQKIYRDNTTEKRKEYQKIYRENNKEILAQKHKEYREKNKEKIAEQKKEYSKKYKEKHKEQLAEKRKEKIQCDRCNAIIRKDYFKKHRQSKTCINALPHGLINKLAE